MTESSEPSINMELRLAWNGSSETSVTFIPMLGDDWEPIAWQRGATDLTITHVKTTPATDSLSVLLHINDDLTLWVTVGDLIDFTPAEVVAFLIDQGPLTDEEREVDGE